jgi:hypothetical protein
MNELAEDIDWCLNWIPKNLDEPTLDEALHGLQQALEYSRSSLQNLLSFS